MVMATDALVPVTDHRPAALEMQRQLGLVETDGRQVAPSLLHQLPSQAGEVWMPMQLPDTIEVAGPGKTCR